jgi:hypothetical protein
MKKLIASLVAATFLAGVVTAGLATPRTGFEANDSRCSLPVARACIHRRSGFGTGPMGAACLLDTAEDTENAESMTRGKGESSRPEHPNT